MDGLHFDALTRSLTTAGSRRRALTGLLGATLGLSGPWAEAGAKNCKKFKNKKKRKKCMAKAKATLCLPSCAFAFCGDDGCGGSCGTCAAPETCQNGRCVCVPKCAGKACGPDGCGDVCGTCTDGRTCQSGQCACPAVECNGACVPACSGSEARAPNCSCCTVAFGLCNMPNTQPCCSGICRDSGTLCCDTCEGLANGATCEFDAQCASGYCPIILGGGPRECSPRTDL
jgi:hypothetical protein